MTLLPGPAAESTNSWRAKLGAYLQQQAQPPHKYGHQPRLYALTCDIASQTPALQVDDDVLYAAAYLHDLGVFLGHRPASAEQLRNWDQVAYVCEKAPALLTNFGFPLEKIPAVLEAIRQHQPSDKPAPPEATVLRDADILEQLGAIGILRVASKLGSDNRFYYFADAARSLTHALESLPAQLRLAASQELAQPRLAALAAFLTALRSEAGQHLG